MANIHIKKKSGLFKSITIASAYNNIMDITVDEHDNVYVADGEIFKQNYKKRNLKNLPQIKIIIKSAVELPVHCGQ